MIVYISGPLTLGGHAEPATIAINHQAFVEAEEWLLNEGHSPVNPLQVAVETGSWEQAMRLNIKALVDCEAILQLPGWTGSAGALWEADIAARLKLIFLTRPQ